MDQLEVSNNIEREIKRLSGIVPLEHRDTSFAVVAVRCNTQESIGKRKLVAGKIYYLLDGYSVEDGDVQTPARHDLNNLYDDFMEGAPLGGPHVQISAIVGKNGSGKSSLVEFIMRLINNFAAITFGEWKSGNSAERLHFINGVNGDLWYISDDHLYQLHVENSNVGLYLCRKAEIESRHQVEESIPLFIDGDPEIHGPVNVLARMDDLELRRLFDHFFYTLISNHSLYAYNSNDFSTECDSDEKEWLISASYPDERFSIEQRCWLHGLFHKNDGYQTPIVISPFRSEGNMNINRENSLARERLISLLIRHNRFRNINDHLTVYGLSYWKDGSKRYGVTRIREELGMQRLTDDGYDMLRSFIVDLWSNAIGVELSVPGDKPLHKLAIDYLVFKTLKIAYTYRQYNKGFKLIEDMEDLFSGEAVNDIVAAQVTDLSHITRKIHQTLAYLIYDVYSDGVENEKTVIEIDFEEIHRRWSKRVYPDLCKNPDFLRSSIKSEVARQALIPPPFLQSKLNLHETSVNTAIDFEALSSGEKQQIYAVSSLLYHLDNLDSVKDDRSDPYRIPYRNVFLILEEVELYFHPELQQQFVRQLLDGIRRVRLSNIASIHIVIVTHSPYVLSDIPKANVLALTDDGLPSDRKLKTFCANIHEMLKDSFFLTHGSQGDFAQWEIGHLMACIDIHKRFREAYSENNTDDPAKRESWLLFVKEMNNDNSDLYRFTHRYIYNTPKSEVPIFRYEDFCIDFSEEKLRERIAIVDEPLVRTLMYRDLNEVFAKTEAELKQARIDELERELRRLKEE